MTWESHFDGHKFTLFEANPNNPAENGLNVDQTEFEIKKKSESWELKDKKHMDGWAPDKIDLFADPSSSDGDFRLYGVVYLNGTPHLLTLREHQDGADTEIFFKYMDLTGSVSPGGTGGARR